MGKYGRDTMLMSPDGQLHEAWVLLYIHKSHHWPIQSRKGKKLASVYSTNLLRQLLLHHPIIYRHEFCRIWETEQHAANNHSIVIAEQMLSGTNIGQVHKHQAPVGGHILSTPLKHISAVGTENIHHKMLRD